MDTPIFDRLAQQRQMFDYTPTYYHIHPDGLVCVSDRDANWISSDGRLCTSPNNSGPMRMEE